MNRQTTTQRNSGMNKQDRNRSMPANMPKEKGMAQPRHGLRHQEHEYKKGDNGGCCGCG